MNILIVDDHEENLYLLESLLKGSGHTVQSAANGTEALALLQAGGIDLIISDILMPVMDGFQLCRKVKTDETLRAIPFIIYTATYTGPQDEAFALKIGADRFILKPCEPDAFMKAVNEVMAAGPCKESGPPPIQEEEALKLYSERLVRKLEQKMVQAEREIKARQAVEASLRESERKYRRLAENTSDVIWTAGMDLKTTYVSPSVERMVGEPVSVHLQRTIEERFPPDSLSSLYVAFAEEMEKETDPDCDKSRSRMMEVQHYRADGSTLWASINISFIRDEDGKPVGLQGVTRDITERKQAEESLRMSEERYRTILENIEAGYYEVDLSGSFTFFNQAMCNILGYANEELLGMNNRTFMDAENAKKVFETFNRVFTTGKTAKAFDWELIRKDKTRCFVDTSIALMRDAEGRPVGFRGIARDITERKQAEAEREKLSAQLIQAQKMESVGRLAGGVAHDFNNMLSVILGYTELAMHKTPPHDPLYEDLREILNAARRSSDITRQLLAFARKQTISPEAIDLNDAVEGMLKMLRRLIGEDIDLAWKPGPKVWPVNMDPAQIDQILANLLVNARDAISGVGKVTIETGNASFDEAYCRDHNGFAAGDYVRLAISDDGCGMDRKTLGKIFEPFFTTKEVGKGTGLGLATVYGIINQNNGFINAYSEPGQGTTFRIYLPRHEGTAAARVHASDPAKNPLSTGETVLIVEDEASILKLAKKILAGLGYTLLTADTPASALKLSGEYSDKIDLLVTDVILPEMNGRDLADRLQAIRPGLKVLYMSGYTADVIAHRGVLETGVHFIQKPFSTKDLAKKVREALLE